MAAETLVVIGATFDSGRPGFVLLSDRAEMTRGDLAHGEDLLDHTCSIAKSSADDPHIRLTKGFRTPAAAVKPCVAAHLSMLRRGVALASASVNGSRSNRSS